jgi:hypothetical protein
MTSKARKIILLLSAVVLTGMVCAVLALMKFKPLDPPLAGSTATPQAKTLGTFRVIAGTGFLISSVTGSPGETSIYEELRSSGRWYGGGSAYNQYNIVFLDTQTETVYPLLPTNDYEIISMEGFPKPTQVFDQAGSSSPEVPIAWWLFSIIKSDTNHDKDFSVLDKQTLSIADVGGRGYTEIIPDVDNVLGTAYKDNNSLLIIYRSNEKTYLAHIDLPSRQVSATEELALGEEIK